MKKLGGLLVIISIVVYIGLFVTWWNNPELTSMQMFQNYLVWQVTGIAISIVGRVAIALDS